MTMGSYPGHAWVGAMLCVIALAATAQEARDPTVAPTDVAAGPGTSGGTDPAQSSTVIVQNGKPYLVVGTRLVAVGQKVGAATLERITETEIWLRDGKQLTKVARFSGIQRTVSKSVSVCAPAVNKPKRKAAHHPARRGVASKVATPQAARSAAPCEGGQP